MRPARCVRRLGPAQMLPCNSAAAPCPASGSPPPGPPTTKPFLCPPWRLRAVVARHRGNTARTATRERHRRMHLQPLLLLQLLAVAGCAAAAGAAQEEGARKLEDPWPAMLGRSQRARPSPIYSYVDKRLDMVDFAIPCLGARLCECQADGPNVNRTFWLNMASAVFQGEVYVAILHRNVVWRASVAFSQEPQGTPPLEDQVVEVNSILFCRAANLTSRPTLQDCQLVEPGANYRERHPARIAKHFELVGLNDPRLISAGDESGLFLQVGCRPKVLSDSITTENYKNLRANFRETVCLIKVRPGSGEAVPASSSAPADSGDDGRGGTSSSEQAALDGAATTTAPSSTAVAAASRTLLGAHQAQLPVPVSVLTVEHINGQGSSHHAVSGRQLQPGDEQPLGGTAAAAAEQAGAAAPPLTGMTITSREWPTGQLLHLQPPAWTHFYEKSWVPFSYRGTLLWSRFLSPHEVVTVHVNGTATTLYSTDSTKALTPLASICGKGPRGNTPALRLTAQQTGLPIDVYLGILHYTPRRGPRRVSSVDRQCDEYLNFFYLTEGEPPFAMLEVANTAIPVQAATNPLLDAEPVNIGMGFISFPAGLTLQGTDVVVTYGCGDREVRIWRAALQNVIGSFLLSWAKRMAPSAGGA